MLVSHKNRIRTEFMSNLDHSPIREWRVLSKTTIQIIPGMTNVMQAVIRFVGCYRVLDLSPLKMNHPSGHCHVYVLSNLP